MPSMKLLAISFVAALTTVALPARAFDVFFSPVAPSSTVAKSPVDIGALNVGDTGRLYVYVDVAPQGYNFQEGGLGISVQQSDPDVLGFTGGGLYNPSFYDGLTTRWSATAFKVPEPETSHVDGVTVIERDVDLSEMSLTFPQAGVYEGTVLSPISYVDSSEAAERIDEMLGLAVWGLGLTDEHPIDAGSDPNTDASGAYYAFGWVDYQITGAGATQVSIDQIAEDVRGGVWMVDNGLNVEADANLGSASIGSAFTVTVIPEPMSLALLSFAGLALLRRRAA